MKRAVRYCMTALLIFQCGSGMAFSRAESAAHEWAGLVLFAAVLVHLILNRRWFGSLFRGKHSPAGSLFTAADAALILTVILIAVSGMVISGYVFSALNLSGAAWGRKIHLSATAWMLLLCGFHYGAHLGKGKGNIPLYISGALGIAAMAVLKFCQRLFLLNEFAYTPDVPRWCVYLMHGLMFTSFMALGIGIKTVLQKGRKHETPEAGHN